jgi:phenylalanyl-tRNA synthetase beta subunit
MGLSTDASHLFERGSDSEQVVNALRRVLYLARGGSSIVKDSFSAHPTGFSDLSGGPSSFGREQRKIQLSYQRIRDEMNLPRLNETEINSRLKYLGYGLDKSSTSKLAVLTVPSWRVWDLFHEQDVVEDVIRSIGLQRVKIELPSLEPIIPERSPREIAILRLRVPLLGSGFHEVMTKGFYTPQEIAPLCELEETFLANHIKISNAIDRSNALWSGKKGHFAI